MFLILPLALLACLPHLGLALGHEDKAWCSDYKIEYCVVKYFKTHCAHKCKDYQNSANDGNWGNWGPWAACTASCGAGTQTSTRLCNNPAPKQGGKACAGSATKTKACTGTTCPVNGAYGPWTYTPCDPSCGSLAMRMKTRYCNNPTPQNGGADCPGVDAFGKQTEPDMTFCSKAACPVHGSVSAWGQWSSSCSKTCGEGGVQTRTRTCDGVANGGRQCAEHLTEQRACNVVACPVDGGYGDWSSYSSCANAGSCGRGYKYRTRCCNNPEPKFGGKSCVAGGKGQPIDIKACYMVPCPLNGGWTGWTAYTSCTKTCGSGTKTRTRTCSFPQARYTGTPCSTTPYGATMSPACNTQACPVDGTWNTWTAYGTCTDYCKKFRTRCCTGVANGGKACPGMAWQADTCTPGQGACPV